MGVLFLLQSSYSYFLHYFQIGSEFPSCDIGDGDCSPGVKTTELESEKSPGPRAEIHNRRVIILLAYTSLADIN
jgi:hypothetical protein